ncbi:MAG: AAA family ATPase, partial [Myxococcales bacterium]|nr:AAA family ATPase [Myxococcales bacterium]
MPLNLPEPARLASASENFAAFFRELQDVFVEREALLGQLALGLLAKEHVLLTGPPGTAKSQVSAAVLGRILDERTGLPSLYARQFTESTVQTDLVGPINFKTLMETGRTEHFTDQGMLGAVHAFLDEVFDGRDMLLRSALNVLQERELKEGTRTVRGLIECAVMTSNRYLAEILEGSRDTLLAFVDRVAFVAFMPRAFADPKNLATVLRRHVGGTGKVTLQRQLSVQDLDALQAQVDSVYVGDAACDAIAQLLESLELELSEAAKADPSFVPTRYVSTRTAVRCGRILRAIVVLDRLFRVKDRPLEVMPSDFAWLRLNLLLSGPSPEMVEKLLARETDPRERRQLQIVRTEREAFDRCIAKLPQFGLSPRAPRNELAALEIATSEALGSDDPKKLSGTLKTLVPLAQGGGPDAERAAVLVRQVGESLTARALRTALRARATPEPEALAAAIAELEELAQRMTEASREESPRARELARFLRGRALTLIDEAFGFDDATAGEVEAVAGGGGSAVVRPIVEKKLGHVERVIAFRQRLLAAGGEVADRARAERSVRDAVLRLEQDCATLLDAGFRDAITTALRTTPADKLGEVLSNLAPDLAELDAFATRITALLPGGERSRLKERVVGPRIEKLVPAIFQRIDASDREAVVGQVRFLHGVLAGAGLARAVDAARFVQWSAAALVRSDRGAPAVNGPPGLARYRALRGVEQRVPI